MEAMVEPSSPASSSFSSSSSSLGIPLGTNYGLALNETDRAELKHHIREAIDHSVQQGLFELRELHDKWERDMPDQLIPLEQVMTLNGIKAFNDFGMKLDVILGYFNNETAVSRQKTHDLFHASEMEQAERQRQEKTKQEAHERRRRRRLGLGELDQYDGFLSPTSSTTTSSWKKTNDAWDDWDENDSW
jgi:hypothetical protein